MKLLQYFHYLDNFLRNTIGKIWVQFLVAPIARNMEQGRVHEATYP